MKSFNNLEIEYIGLATASGSLGIAGAYHLPTQNVGSIDTYTENGALRPIEPGYLERKDDNKS